MDSDEMDIKETLEKVEEKINKIKQSLKKKGKRWFAGKTSVSELTYAERKKLYGQSDIPPGMEYYSGGVIELGNNLPSAAAAREAPAPAGERERIGLPQRGTPTAAGLIGRRGQPPNPAPGNRPGATRDGNPTR